MAGAARDVEVVSAANETLGDSAMRALRSASPFPPMDGASRCLADKRIRIFSDGKQLGITARLNQGIDQSRGSLIARMDGDDFAYPCRLQKQVEFLLQNPQIDLIGTSMVVFDKDFKVVGKRVVPAQRQKIIANPLRGFPLMHPTFMGREAWFKKHRYAICMGSEDQDLLLRTFRQSHFSNLPEILFAYRENSIEPEKYARGRKSYLQSLKREGFVPKGSLKLWYKLSFNQIKRVLDHAAVLSGLNYKLLKNRCRPANASDEAQFNKWLKQLRNS